MGGGAAALEAVLEMAADGEDLSPWVPAGVAEYIHNHGLYQTKEAVEQ